MATLALVMAPACIEAEATDPQTLRLLSVTRQTPSFAGVHSENGALTVFIFDESKRAAANERLRAILGDPLPALLLRPARGTASEALKNSAGDVLSAGASFLDFDETVGYLRIGVPKASALEPVQAKLGELAIPLDEVILEYRGVVSLGL